MNILQVMSDQHQARLMGCEGSAAVVTPNMDRLAREGVRFSRAYAQNTICTPSRVCVLSGQYCHNHGYYGLSGHRPEGLPTFLGHFRAAGHRTAALGKIHLPNHPTDWAAEDCDLFGDYMMSRPDSAYKQYARAQGFFDQIDHERLPEFPGRQQWDARPSSLSFEQSVEGFTCSEAIRFMDDARRGGRPFCLQVSFFRPHQCYTPAARFWDLYDDAELPPLLHQDASHRAPHFQRMWRSFHDMRGLIEPMDFESFARRLWRGYRACVSHVDHALGLLLDYLDGAGLAGETVVVYHSDHGAYSGVHGIGEKAPGICSEAVCRIPMLWRAPGVSRAGHVSDALVETVDLAPTFASLAGLPSFLTGDGFDLVPLLRGGEGPLRDGAVTENPWTKSIRFGRWRFVHYQPEMFPGSDTGELYDLDADPAEQVNLYRDAGCRDIVERARRLLLEWIVRTRRVATAFTPAARTLEEQLQLVGPDGKELNIAGPAARLRQGSLNYL